MISVIVPVYCPEETFVPFIQSLNQELQENLSGESYRVIIVNDGNDGGSKCFDELSALSQVDILHHAVNQGKGRAIKTALNHILLAYPDCGVCVTCDADGQHAVSDILKIIAGCNLPYGKKIVLGVRDFSNPTIPLRSRLGNNITRLLFRLLTGLNIKDTQTGLRVFSSRDCIRQCMMIEGERYEYETNMLLFCKTSSIPIVQVPIKTIYLDNNRTSHFNPILDSIKIYKLLIKFAVSALSTSLLDFIAFSIVYFFTKQLFVAMSVARIISICFNFYVNKNMVFKRHKSSISQFAKYSVLALFLFLTSYFGIRLLANVIPASIYVLKVMMESLLFLISYSVQRDCIFK